MEESNKTLEQLSLKRLDYPFEKKAICLYNELCETKDEYGLIDKSIVETYTQPRKKAFESLIKCGYVLDTYFGYYVIAGNIVNPTIQFALIHNPEDVLVDSKKTMENIAQISQKRLKEVKVEDDVCEEFLDIFNRMCGIRLGRVIKIGPTRKKFIREFLIDMTKEDFEKVCSIAINTDFLCGKNNRQWKASFDWLINKNNAIKVLEGKYCNNQTFDASQFRDTILNSFDRDIIER